jgi:hypothetical protein
MTTILLYVVYYAFILAIGIIGPFALCVGAAYVEKGLMRLAAKADAIKNPIVRKGAGYAVAGLMAALTLVVMTILYGGS